MEYFSSFEREEEQFRSLGEVGGEVWVGTENKPLLQRG